MKRHNGHLERTRTKRKWRECGHARRLHANPRGPVTGAGAGDVLGLPALSHAARARRMQLQEALLAREAAEAVQDTVCTGHA